MKKTFWNDNLNGVYKEFWDLDRRWMEPSKRITQKIHTKGKGTQMETVG